MTEWHMECDSGTYIAAISEMYFIGFVVGSFIAPYISSRLGMKTVVVFRSFGLVAINLTLLYLPKQQGLEWS